MSRENKDLPFHEQENMEKKKLGETVDIADEEEDEEISI